MSQRKATMKDRLQEALSIRNKKAVDLVQDLKIPKAAISQYLSGKSQKMSSERLYLIASYLEVSEPWLLGFEVPMEKNMSLIKKENSRIATAALKMQKNEVFFSVVDKLLDYDDEKLSGLLTILK